MEETDIKEEVKQGEPNQQEPLEPKNEANEKQAIEEAKQDNLPPKAQIEKSKSMVPSVKKEISLLEDNETVRILLSSKIKEYKVNSQFTLEYAKAFIGVVTKFHELIFPSIWNNLQANMNIISFLKGLTVALKEIYDSLFKLTYQFKIPLQAKSDKKDSKPMVDKKYALTAITLKTTYDSFLAVKNELETRIFSKGPIKDAEAVLIKIESQKKEGLKRIAKLERRKRKLEKLYKSKFEPLFLKLIPAGAEGIAKSNNSRYVYEDFEDFLVIDKEIYERLNKLLLKYSLYLTDLKENLNTLSNLIGDFCKAVRNSLLIYVEECKKLYNLEVLKPFFSLEQYVTEINEKLSHTTNPNYFKIKDLFREESEINAMNKVLKDYQMIVKESKDKNELTMTSDTFDITKYENVESFFENLISLSPKPFNTNGDMFQLNSWNVRRDPGFFSAWRNCTLIITKQNHLLFFDNALANKYDLVFELGRIKFSGKADRKLKYLFELDAFKKGKVMYYTGKYTFDAIKEETLREIEKYVSSAPLDK